MSLDKINDTSLIGIEGHIKNMDPESAKYWCVEEMQLIMKT